MLRAQRNAYRLQSNARCPSGVFDSVHRRFKGFATAQPAGACLCSPCRIAVSSFPITNIDLALPNRAVFQQTIVAVGVRRHELYPFNPPSTSPHRQVLMFRLCRVNSTFLKHYGLITLLVVDVEYVSIELCAMSISLAAAFNCVSRRSFANSVHLHPTFNLVSPVPFTKQMPYQWLFS
jgi:hypothetical protein